MAVTIGQTEENPAAYPDAPAGLSTAAAALDADMLWQRLESYVAHRWTARSVVWVVEGPGNWQPPLTPAVVSLVELWDDDDGWTTTLPGASPMGGYAFDGVGPYRVTAMVGSGTVPAAVLEAFRRLAEYSVEMGKDGMMSGHPSHSSHSAKIGDSIEETFTRPSNWAGRALQLSGAADLLRPYRRA